MSCSVAMQTGCMPGQVCEEVEGAAPACFAPLALQGKIVHALDGTAIQGARVLARDTSGAAISVAAFTAPDGTYTLYVPAKRDGAGKPLPAKLTLRAEASGHQAFPLAPRVATPIDVATAAGNPPVVENAATDIALFPLNDAATRGWITGKVVVDAGLDLSPAGALVVAEGATGVVDRAGNFVVYNVLAGGVGVFAYAGGLKTSPAALFINAGQETSGVQLHVTGAATAKISGSVQIVNASGAAVTSVALMPKGTFVEAVGRGEAIKGLLIDNVTGSFQFSGVPNGDYRVVAAFDDDGLVRDPISVVPNVFVNGKDIVLPESLKLTGALGVVSPGATGIDVVSGTPVFTWADDTSEDAYEVRLFDVHGQKVWETVLPGASGAPSVSLTYAGPPLTPKMLYQFRATSKKSSSFLSQTEDLEGAFVAMP